MSHTASPTTLLLLLGLLQTPAQPQPEWMTIRPTDWDFALSFPARPVDKSRRVFSFAGSIQQTLYLCESEGVEFLAQRIHFPRPFTPKQATERLAVEKKGYLPRHSELIAVKPLTLADEPGEELTYKVPSIRGKGIVTCRTRHFVKGSSYYSLTVSSVADNPLPDATDRFLISLRFDAASGPTLTRSASAVVASTKNPTGTQSPRKSTGAPAVSDPVVTPAKVSSGFTTPLKVRVNDATSEDALRTYLLAIVAKDGDALRSVSVAHQDLERLLERPAVSPQDFSGYEARLTQNPFRRLNIHERVNLPGGDVYTVRARDVGRGHALLISADLALPINLQEIQGHWKVDPDPFIAAIQAASASSLTP